MISWFFSESSHVSRMSVTRQARADKQSQLMSNRLMTKSSPYIRLRSLNKNGLLIAQFSRYHFIQSAKLFTRYISRPILFKIYGCDLVVNLLDIIGYISGHPLVPVVLDRANYVCQVGPNYPDVVIEYVAWTPTCLRITHPSPSLSVSPSFIIPPSPLQ